MATETTTSKRLRCPSCGKKGKRVGPVTLRALLRDDCREAVSDQEDHPCESEGTGCKPVMDDTGWRFCDSRECDIVYFGEHDDTTITKSQLKVAVGVKESTGERPLCYCFGHSVASIKEELRTKGRSDALEDIRRKMKDPGCSCEVTNPSGACCLGSVAKGIQTAERELRSTGSNNDPPGSSRSASGFGEKFSKMGALISAVVASSCCWLPLVLLAVGISGAGIAATLEAYRPLFIVVTFGFLGAAFYFTYRPRKAAAEGKHACCATEPSATTEQCCPPSGKRRLSMMTMNKIMLWVVTVLAVAFLLFPSYVGRLLASGNGAAVSTGMNQAVVKIEGMTCEGCAAVAEKAIRSVPRVLAVEVDYQKGQALVGAEACCPLPREGILSALESVGYKGAFVETPHAASRHGGSATTTRNGDGSAASGAQGDRPDEKAQQVTLAVSGIT